MTKLSAAAYDYLAAGLTIIALTGKQPNTLFHKHGLLDALTGRPDSVGDLDLIERVFTHPSTTGVGLVIEYPYLVVDIDGEEGARAYADMIGTMSIDVDTPVARTARGLHIWYGDLKPRRSRKLAEKLDLKAVGGYVVAPPSQHPDVDFQYYWITPILAAKGEMQRPMEAPDELRDLLDEVGSVEDENRPEKRQLFPVLLLENGRLRLGHEEATIAGLAAYVSRLREGNRNDGLWWAAATAQEDGYSYAQAFAALLPAAVATGLDVPEATTAIKSGYRRTNRDAIPTE